MYSVFSLLYLKEEENGSQFKISVYISKLWEYEGKKMIKYDLCPDKGQVYESAPNSIYISDYLHKMIWF